MTRERAKLIIRGAVQGVGFRPFVYRLAAALDLDGWVSNSAQGVFIEVEGAHETLERFLLRLEKEKPSLAVIQSLEASFLDPIGYKGFEIRPSDESGNKIVAMLPDIATCAACRREILDPTNRRYLYPFTNCTNCGPRFTIIESLPYDRPNTSMKKFTMCAACQKEYDDPRDRRFHAQPNACPHCGPYMELEFAIGEARTEEAYPFRVSDYSFWTDAPPATNNRSSIRNPAIAIDWEPMILAIAKDVKHRQAIEIIATKFHNTLAEIIVDLARTIGEKRIVLTGGCFQNKYLTERAVRRLMDEGFKPYWHQRVPPNDGGIALGQVMAAVLEKGKMR